MIFYPYQYTHPDDKKALDSLKKIPIFPTIFRQFNKFYNEKLIKIDNLSSKIRVSEKQLPEIYNLLPPICSALNIKIPEIYVENDRELNAYTMGETETSITLTSGIVESMALDQLKVVIAHECGHIACHHVLYSQIASLIFNGSIASIPGLGIVGSAIELALTGAFFHWRRCSEFSADRAALLCLGGSKETIEVMSILSGGKILAGKIDTELFLNQALDFEKYLQGGAINSFLSFKTLYDLDHPWNSVRALYAKRWSESDEFKNLLNPLRKIKSDNTNKNSIDLLCPYCFAHIEKGWKFCKSCGKEL